MNQDRNREMISSKKGILQCWGRHRNEEEPEKEQRHKGTVRMEWNDLRTGEESKPSGETGERRLGSEIQETGESKEKVRIFGITMRRVRSIN